MQTNNIVRRPRNVTDPFINEYVDTARLCDALWAYRDYPEVKEEFEALREKRDKLRRPKLPFGGR